MRSFVLFLPAVLWVPALLAQGSAPPTPPAKSTAATPKTAPAKTASTAASGAVTFTSDDERVIYAIGLQFARSLKPFDLSPAELELVKRAISDAVAGHPAEDLDAWAPKMIPLATLRGPRVAEKQKALSRTYLAKAAAEPGAVKTASGLIYKQLRAGTGPSPKATDTVKVNYRGTLTDGSEFDSSYKRKEPTQFPLNGVVPCWTEGVQKIKVGGKAQLVCPSDIAYGDHGRPPTIPGGATLIFEIELLEIVNSGSSGGR